jgi:hypothetical protein
MEHRIQYLERVMIMAQHLDQYAITRNYLSVSVVVSLISLSRVQVVLNEFFKFSVYIGWVTCGVTVFCGVTTVS